jgi:uncharacterized protein Yka (UPF0111/DUF47 family)
MATCQSAVTALAAFLRDYRDLEARAAAIHAIEHQGNTLTGALVASLRRGEGSPLAARDVCALARGIDDVLDGIDAVATMLVLYHVAQPSVYLREAVRLLDHAVEALAPAIDAVGMPTVLESHTAAVHRLEVEADGLYHNAIAELFLPNAYPAIEVIKWRAILDVMERTIDRCEDLSIVLEAAPVAETREARRVREGCGA